MIVDVAYPLVPQVDIRFDFLSFTEHCGANVIGVEDEHPPFSVSLCNNLAFFLFEAPEMREPDLHPLVEDLSDSSRFFVIVRTCNTFMTFPFCLTWLRRTSLKFSIGCGVSSPVATIPDCISFSRYENHSLWLVMWFDAPESTYHTSSDFGVVFCWD